MEYRQSLHKWCWENWTGTCKKKMKLDSQFMPYTRINSKCIKYLNRSHDTVKVLEANIGSKISDIPCSNIFANISPRAREIKEKNKQMGLSQIKYFLHS